MERPGTPGTAERVVSDAERRAARLAEIERLLRIPIEADAFKHRTVGGGKNAAYVPTEELVERANIIFTPSGWSSDITKLEVDYAVQTSAGRWNVGVFCLMKVSIVIEGVVISSHEDLGYGEAANQPAFSSAAELARKSAVTDARKRVLRLFGPALGGQVGSEEFQKEMQEHKKQALIARALAARASAAAPFASSSSSAYDNCGGGGGGAQYAPPMAYAVGPSGPPFSSPSSAAPQQQGAHPSAGHAVSRGPSGAAAAAPRHPSDTPFPAATGGGTAGRGLAPGAGHQTPSATTTRYVSGELLSTGLYPGGAQQQQPQRQQQNGGGSSAQQQGGGGGGGGAPHASGTPPCAPEFQSSQSDELLMAMALDLEAKASTSASALVVTSPGTSTTSAAAAAGAGAASTSLPLFSSTAFAGNEGGAEVPSAATSPLAADPPAAAAAAAAAPVGGKRPHVVFAEPPASSSSSGTSAVGDPGASSSGATAAAEDGEQRKRRIAEKAEAARAIKRRKEEAAAALAAQPAPAAAAAFQYSGASPHEPQ